MTIPDPLDAFKAVLAADAEIVALVADRIYGDELDGEVVPTMPQPAIVIASNGGRYVPDDMQVSLYRVNTHCYGATMAEAAQVDLLVYQAFKRVRRVGFSGIGGILHITVDSGPFSLRDPDTTWPYVLCTYRGLVGEVIHA